MRVKICGITNEADARVAVKAGADFIGLIRAESVRSVSLETAKAIVAAIAGAGTQPVLLFRDAPLDQVIAESDAVGVRWVQLHGDESERYIRDLRKSRPRLRIIRAWEAQRGPMDLLTHLHASQVDGRTIEVVILDAPKGGPHPGHEHIGSVAEALNQAWSRADGRPGVWCAAGLTPDNVVEAVKLGTFDGVDVARGVENGPGRKDHAAVRRFIEMVRSL